MISNSENMNMVMAMILPVPGKRELFSIGKYEHGYGYDPASSTW